MPACGLRAPRISLMINGLIYGDDDGDSFYDKDGSRKWNATKKELGLTDSDREISKAIITTMETCKK